MPINTGRSSWYDGPSEMPVDPPVDDAPPETDEKLENLLQYQEMMKRILPLEEDHSRTQEELKQLTERHEASEIAIELDKLANRELRVRMTSVERSRSEWRRHAQVSDAKVGRMEREIEDLKREIRAIQRGNLEGTASSGI